MTPYFLQENKFPRPRPFYDFFLIYSKPNLMALSKEDKVRLRKQIEFYFSDANLIRDKFLKKCVAENRFGFVPLEILSTFNRVAIITKEIEAIAEVLKESTELTLNETGTAVCRKEPLLESTDFAAQSIVMFPLPRDLDLEKLQAAVLKCRPALKILAVWMRQKRVPAAIPDSSFRFAEVVFGSCTEAETFCKKMNADNTMKNFLQVLEEDEGKEKEAKKTSEVEKVQTFHEPLQIMTKEDFNKKMGKNQPEQKKEEEVSPLSVEKIKHCVLRLHAPIPLGPISRIKSWLNPELRKQLRYLHTLEEHLNEMLVVCCTPESKNIVKAAYLKIAISDEKREEMHTIEVDDIDEEETLQLLHKALQKRDIHFQEKRSQKEKKYGRKRRFVKRDRD